MKNDKKKIALERMHILIKNAISNSSSNPKLAQRQALLVKKISNKHRIPIPYEIKISFCKKCKKFIAPGINSRIRLGRSSVKSIRITCNFCGHIYRKVIAQ
jgi:ribonuclease P protein subunit RPR2